MYQANDAKATQVGPPKLPRHNPTHPLMPPGFFTQKAARTKSAPGPQKYPSLIQGLHPGCGPIETL
jgi:hypothetical protein